MPLDGRARPALAPTRGARPVLALSCALLALGGCAGWRAFTRPEGDGGWSAERRRAEVEKAGQAAGVAVDGVSVTPQEAPSVPPEDGDSAGRGAPASQPDADLPLAPGAGPAGTTAGARSTSRLDLPTALAMAERGNRRIREADRQLAATAEHVMDVRGRLLPATAASARYTWYSDAQTTNVDFSSGELPPGFTVPTVRVRDAENGVVNSTIAIPIDLSGELRHTLAAAQAGYRGERARIWAVTLEQQLLVARTYFDLLEALRLREVAEQTVALYRKQLAIAQQRYENGRLTKNDLLTFDVARKEAEQAILQRDLAIERARWSLNDAIGADVNQAVDPVDVRTPPVVPSTEEALRMTYEHNPVLVSLLEEQQRLDETATALVRNRLPRFHGGGAVDYQSSDLLQPQQIGSGFVGFTWDLGTDLRREAQIAQARIEADRNRVATERQMRELEVLVRSAQLSAVERVAAYATAESAVGQAEENLRIREQQFDVGRAQSDDVLIAERLLAQQRATLATALYQAHVRRAELRRLIGLSIDPE
jgi:outer membrane protein TolC